MSYQENSDYLVRQCQSLVDAGNWQEGLRVAKTLISMFPECLTGWTDRAYCLRRLQSGGLAQARQALLEALDRFPNEYIIPYNLACYAAQEGGSDKVEEAWDWLCRAARIAPGIVKAEAAGDMDLMPLRSRLHKLG